MEILLLAVIAVLAVLGSGQFGLFDRILSPGPISPVEFAELALPKSPNAYLVGPKGYTTALPHADAPESLRLAAVSCNFTVRQGRARLWERPGLLIGSANPLTTVWW